MRMYYLHELVSMDGDCFRAIPGQRMYGPYHTYMQAMGDVTEKQKMANSRLMVVESPEMETEIITGPVNPPPARPF